MLSGTQPTFDQSVQTLQLSEAAALRESRVQLALANDPDWAANAPTEYLLEPVAPTANPLPFQLVSVCHSTPLYSTVLFHSITSIEYSSVLYSIAQYVYSRAQFMHSTAM